ncbi:hypothetical protein [Modestobacter roseus]|uniref:hypothetical protein n=1 Tax=Modestobacter roseus TaxID=1181884 RepID=UPI001296DCA6|nr:hypothetical protein [Modestobacter roseus]MQA35964.1 hypothetical protein [Modestobacter roseus]
MTKTNNTTTTAYDAARTAREAAEQAHTDAVQAVEQARTQQAEVVQRNAAGDTTVTALDLLTADAEITRREGLAQSAAAEAEAARAAEAPLLAEHYADVLSERVLRAEVTAEDAVLQSLTDALSLYVEQVRERETVMLEAARQASAVGIPNGSQEFRFGWRTTYGTKLPDAVFIDGEMLPFIRQDRALLDVLTQALTAVGYRLTAPGYIELKTR